MSVNQIREMNIFGVFFKLFIPRDMFERFLFKLEILLLVLVRR